MAQEYNNNGPIYTTTAKYEALKTAGNLEVGREYRLVDWEGQEKLIAGDNIEIGTDGKTIDVIQKPYTSINQIADYLYEVQYSAGNIDYEYGVDYFDNYTPSNTSGGGCTGVYKDGRVLRQLDWYYNNECEFLVRTVGDSDSSIYSSIGLSAGVTGLTKDFVESGEYSRKYKMVPLIMTDGINEKGLYMQSNVVPENDITYDINPTGTTKIYITMLIRYLLDHCDGFTSLENTLNTIHIKSTSAVDFGYHLLVAQGTEWRIYEFTASGWEKTTSTDVPYGIMTNFRTRVGSNFITFTNSTLNWSSVEQYGTGLERYSIAQQAYNTTNPKTLEELRSELKFSKLYTEETNLWYSEFCGEDDPTNPGTKLTVTDAKDNTDKFTSIFTTQRSNWNTKTRENGKDTWHTTHSAIYDLSNKSIDLCIQEVMTKSYKFSLEESISTIKDIVKLIPTQASESNQLADKNFVNSSISTNTSNHISNSGQPFSSLLELQAYTGTVTNNDYAFVTSTDTSGNTVYDRYKATVSGTTVTWALEYRLNNSSFTASQWTAINSGITSILVGSMATKVTNPTSGNLAGLDSNGNITDSTYNSDSFVQTESQSLTESKKTQARNNIGSASSSDLTTHTGDSTVHITSTERNTWNGKATKVSGATNNNFAGLDSNGELKDSTYNSDSFVQIGSQSLTDSQKTQVRTNINALGARTETSTLDSTLTVDTIYNLGSISTLSFTLPSTGNGNNEIEVNFTASASFTPTITGTYNGESIYATTTNKLYSYLFSWINGSWFLGILEY